MSLKASTGLRNALLDTGSLKSLLDGGYIQIFDGAIPVDADAGTGTSVLLCTITVGADGITGLTMDTAAANGSLSKANEVWSGVNAATGVATYWRFIKTGDVGTSSTTAVRLQGIAATSGAELVMTSTSLVSGATQGIDFFAISLPA